MVTYCCVKNCKSCSDKHNNNYASLHKFPCANPEIHQQWIAAVQGSKRNKDWTPTKHSRVCSKHFKDTDYYPNQAIRRLRENAIPTLCLNPRENEIVSSANEVNVSVKSEPELSSMMRSDESAADEVFVSVKSEPEVSSTMQCDKSSADEVDVSVKSEESPSMQCFKIYYFGIAVPCDVEATHSQAT